MGSEIIELLNDWTVEGFARGVGMARGVHRASYKSFAAVPARVPGTVRQALLNAKLIPDPYYGDNVERSLWVEDLEWWFVIRFSISGKYRERFVTLEFQGINYSGEVYLNDELVGALTGMFNPASFDVSSKLRFASQNYLAVRLEAPPGSRTSGILNGRAIEEPDKQLYSIAQFCFGWDWAPHLVPIGIWRPVLFKSTGAGRLKNPYVVTRITGEDSARVEVAVDVRNISGRERRFELEGRITGSDFTCRPERFKESITVPAGGSRTVKAEVDVASPRLWWPHTMGDQPLYRLDLNLTTEAGLGSDRVETLFGIREVEIVLNDKADEVIKQEMAAETGDVPAVYSMGKVAKSYPWTFQVNGRKMYAVGANWVPMDSLLNIPVERYEHLVRLARSADMNLLRVWGGGLYETDEFYELCDRLGILTWQDFLSNRDVGDIDRKTLTAGVREAVLRLRNHPSLVLWCGGNEFDPDNRRSCELVDELSEIVSELDPGREFHRASPYMGDDHYWGVWHRKEPYTAYRRVRPFRSEAGLSAPPDSALLKRFIPEADLWPCNRDMWEYHGERIPQRKQMEKMDRYVNEYGPAGSLEEYVRKAQIAQAIGNQFNVEFCRRNKYVNSGVLIWQYNDCWPAISWSLVDWYGRPKPSYYYLKRAARPVHLVADYERYLWAPGEKFMADLHLINDRQAELAGLTCRAVLFDLEQKRLSEFETVADIGPDRSIPVGEIAWDIPGDFAPSVFFLHLDLIDRDGRCLSSNLYWLACGSLSKPERPKGSKKEKVSDLPNYQAIFEPLDSLPPAALDYEIERREILIRPGSHHAFDLTIKNPSPYPAFQVGIETEGLPEGTHLLFSDNYFHLMPGDELTLSVDCWVAGARPGRCHPRLIISGWNCPPVEIETDLRLEGR